MRPASDFQGAAKPLLNDILKSWGKRDPAKAVEWMTAHPEMADLGQVQGNAIETTEGGGSRVEQRAQFSIDFQRRGGRKWRGDEGFRSFADGADGQIMARGSSVHGFKLKIFGDFFNLKSEMERIVSIPEESGSFLHDSNRPTNTASPAVNLTKGKNYACSVISRICALNQGARARRSFVRLNWERKSSGIRFIGIAG